MLRDKLKLLTQMNFPKIRENFGCERTSFSGNKYKENKIYLGKHAKQGLNMVARNGITNESPCFISHELEKLKRGKLGKITIMRTPSPVKIRRIRAAIFHTILVHFDKPATVVCVFWSRWIRNPLSMKKITFFYNTTNPTTTTTTTLIKCYISSKQQ